MYVRTRGYMFVCPLEDYTRVTAGGPQSREHRDGERADGRVKRHQRAPRTASLTAASCSPVSRACMTFYININIMSTERG